MTPPASKPDFSVIAEQYYDRIFRGAFCVTGDRDAAEDIAQETFLLALRNYQSFNAKSSVFTWLYRIMLRVYSRMRRHDRMRRRLEFFRLYQSTVERDSLREVMVTSSSPGAGDEEQSAVRNAVRDLSHRLHVVVAMYYFDDLSLQEIADVLECPLGTVKSRLFLARKRLAMALRAIRS